MGQKSKRKGAKGASGGANAMIPANALTPMRELNNFNGAKSNINANMKPSADCILKVRMIEFAGICN